jgi:TolA-binding protein
MNIDQIERYIKGLMSNQERSAFEQKLKEDTELRAEYEQLMHEITGIEAYYLKKSLSSKPMNSETNPSRKSNWTRYLPWAVVVLILIILFIWLINKPKPEIAPGQPQKEYAQFEPDTGLPTPMGETNNYEFLNGMVKYKAGDYEGAIEIWSKMYNEGAKNDTVSYFLGNAYQSIDQLKLAEQHYYEVRMTRGSAYRPQAIYNLALISLEEKDADQAKKYLQEIDLPKAKELLEQIKYYC